jgi:hypothetical protein
MELGLFEKITFFPPDPLSPSPPCRRRNKRRLEDREDRLKVEDDKDNDGGRGKLGGGYGDGDGGGGKRKKGF